MSERSKQISKLKESGTTRASYLRAKLNVNVPSQIRALRRRRNLNQTELGRLAGMMQSRISNLERPGEVGINVETLVRLAAAFRVGLIVKFAPFGEVLDWENGFSQDTFDVVPIESDAQFLNPEAESNVIPFVNANSRSMHIGSGFPGSDLGLVRDSPAGELDSEVEFPKLKEA